MIEYTIILRYNYIIKIKHCQLCGTETRCGRKNTITITDNRKILTVDLNKSDDKRGNLAKY